MIGSGATEMEPGSAEGMLLVVDDNAWQLQAPAA
jgi:hypothetical protein